MRRQAATPIRARNDKSAGQGLPVPARRDGQWLFRVVLALLTLEYTGLGVFYLADPAGADRGLPHANQVLGGIPLLAPDVPVWRYATAAALIAAGLMCAMLLADLRRNLPVLLPLAFFKAFDATLWFWFSARHGHGQLPVGYAAGTLDWVQVLALIVVTLRAHARLVRPGGTA